MNKKKEKEETLSRKITLKFEAFAVGITKFVGSATAFIFAFSVVLCWGISGPFFEFSQTWQIVINTATTIVTFLMVFLIQHSQNKDNASLQIKLDEIIDSIERADDDIIDVEELSEEELSVLKKYYKKLGIKFNKDDVDINDIERAKEMAKEKEKKKENDDDK